MTRSILALVGVAASLAVFVGPGCKTTGVGDPCTPEQEFNTDFSSFDKNEVNVESRSFQCETRLCLVNHFQGRVSCQYGQKSLNGKPAPPDGLTDPGDRCFVPGSNRAEPDLIVGPSSGPGVNNPVVRPQCADRTADNAVYCSCRCANTEGRTDDGANYCSCPDGFECTQLVTSIGKADTGLTGAYCIKASTEFRPGLACQTTCDPQKTPCPGPQGPK